MPVANIQEKVIAKILLVKDKNKVMIQNKYTIAFITINTGNGIVPNGNL
jgi:hypothetical protein